MALEVDSEEESVGPKSPLSPLSSDVERSEDKEETFPLPSPDLTCTRSQSASAYEPTSQVIYHPLIKYFGLSVHEVLYKFYTHAFKHYLFLM